VRILRGQFSLCNVLCNATQIGLVGFVWFAFIATNGYLSILEIGIRFIEKLVFCTDSADLVNLVSLVSLVNSVNCQAKNLLFNKPHIPKPHPNLPTQPLQSKTAVYSPQHTELDTRPFFGLILLHAQARRHTHRRTTSQSSC
jgi:hypothetical protein